MAASLSRSAIDALGKRLARAVVADPVDLQQLFAHQRECIEALEQTLNAIAETVQNDPPRGVPAHVTHRVKTVETLIDKLRRGTALSRMQDLVGIRVVGDFGLSGQDDLVDRLVHRFPGARVDDRRVRPSPWLSSGACCTESRWLLDRNTGSDQSSTCLGERDGAACGSMGPGDPLRRQPHGRKRRRDNPSRACVVSLDGCFQMYR